MRKILRLIFAKLAEWLNLNSNISFCEDIPETVRNNTFYIVGDAKNPWLLVFNCPCGCNSIIQLNLLKEADPHWRYKIDNGQINIKPSVWRTVGCKSHFFIEDGRVDWVRHQPSKPMYSKGKTFGSQF